MTFYYYEMCNNASKPSALVTKSERISRWKQKEVQAWKEKIGVKKGQAGLKDSTTNSLINCDLNLRPNWSDLQPYLLTWRFGRCKHKNALASGGALDLWVTPPRRSRNMQLSETW